MKTASLLLCALLLVATTACQSTQVRIPTAPIGPNEKSLGYTQGESTGRLVLFFIPVQQNERFVTAYNKAVMAREGANRLTDVTISERWWWGYIMNGYKFKVEGTAVGNK